MSDTISYMLKASTGQSLGALASILGKAKAHASETDVEESVFLSARLFPDMFPLLRQVQVATDITKRGGERLAGVEPASTPDDETNFDELIARCAAANEAVQGLDDDALNANENVTLQVPIGDQTMPMEGRFFLSNFILPNLHFHAATAYNLLRMQGVVLGKRDFLMPGGA